MARTTVGSLRVACGILLLAAIGSACAASRQAALPPPESPDDQRLDANAAYNAAVGYVNAGLPADAAMHAERAAQYADFRELAEKLLAAIAERRP